MGKKKDDKKDDDYPSWAISPIAPTYSTSIPPGSFFFDYPRQQLQLPKPAEPEPLASEASTEVIVGYRAWALRRSFPEGYRLKALYSATSVEPNHRIEATCELATRQSFMSASSFGNWSPFSTRTTMTAAAAAAQTHDAPHAGCQCGIYAYRDSVEITEGEDHKPFVVGEVNLWGRVLECETGYRAQYAYPKRLVLVFGGERANRIATDLELAYGVPCEAWS